MPLLLPASRSKETTAERGKEGEEGQALVHAYTIRAQTYRVTHDPFSAPPSQRPQWASAKEEKKQGSDRERRHTSWSNIEGGIHAGQQEIRRITHDAVAALDGAYPHPHSDFLYALPICVAVRACVLACVQESLFFRSFFSFFLSLFISSTSSSSLPLVFVVPSVFVCVWRHVYVYPYMRARVCACGLFLLSSGNPHPQRVHRRVVCRRCIRVCAHAHTSVILICATVKTRKKKRIKAKADAKQGRSRHCRADALSLSLSRSLLSSCLLSLFGSSSTYSFNCSSHDSNHCCTVVIDPWRTKAADG